MGHELSRRGVNFLILEQGMVAGESFTHLPRKLTFGPWMNNTLPGSRVTWTWLLRRATQPAYCAYLSAYALHYHLPIQYRCRVLQVSREKEGFVVVTGTGTYRSQLLINCTGYFSNPNKPEYPGQSQSKILALHSCEFREASDLSERMGVRGAGILVVGAGLSSGEALLDLHRNGETVALSHGGIVRFGPSPWLEILLAPWNWLLERMAIALNLRLSSQAPMAGGPVQKLLKSGTIRRFPAISHFAENEVVFRDGQRHRFDGVVFATGYRYSRDHLDGLAPEDGLLCQGLESAKCPGLFFLGLDQQRTYRSRYLRGIRADARLLGKLLALRLNLKDPPVAAAFVFEPPQK